MTTSHPFSARTSAVSRFTSERIKSCMQPVRRATRNFLGCVAGGRTGGISASEKAFRISGASGSKSRRVAGRKRTRPAERNRSWRPDCCHKRSPIPVHRRSRGWVKRVRSVIQRQNVLSGCERRPAFSISALAVSKRSAYWTPAGQAVSQARHPRQNDISSANERFISNAPSATARMSEIRPRGLLRSNLVWS